MNWLGKLLSSDDLGADSVVVAMLLCVMTFCGISIYSAWEHPEAWNPTNFGGGAALVVGVIGVAKGWRDKLSPPSQGQ
jgi:hypothetical protein